MLGHDSMGGIGIQGRKGCVDISCSPCLSGMKFMVCVESQCHKGCVDPYHILSVLGDDFRVCVENRCHK